MKIRFGNALLLLSAVGMTVASPNCAFDSDRLQQFWNGTSCVPCTSCPPGYGLGTPCTLRKDSTCIQCYPGYDYSGDHSLEACRLCFQETNCLEGEAKIVQNCTVTSPPVCDGCKDNYYFDPNAGGVGGCVECSRKCNAVEVEVVSCNTKHDRKCVRALATIEVVTSTPFSKEDPPSLMPGSDKHLPDQEKSQNPTNPSKDWFKNPGILLAIIVPVVAVITAVGLVHYRKKKRNERRARSSSDEKSLKLSLLPVRSSSLTLDSPVRDLSIDQASLIANHLNAVDIHGYPYWQRVAEKLGFSEQCKGWVNVENPTKKLLHVFGEKEDGTIRVFIKALEEVDLTLLSTILKAKFENSASSPTPPNP